MEVEEPPRRTSFRVVTAAAFAALAAFGCALLAAAAATAAEGGELLAAIDESGTLEAPRRRLKEAAPAAAPPPCRAALEGEPCHREVTWAMRRGIHEHAEWYPGLSPSSTFEEFQAHLHLDPYVACPRPCSAPASSARRTQTLDANGTIGASNASQSDDAAAAAAAAAASSAVLGWEPSSRVVSQGQWCSVNEPRQGWMLQGCGAGHGIQLKVLTYNLFWWSLFGRRSGNGGSAGRLVASAHAAQPVDLLGFQECEGVDWVLGDAGLTSEFAALPGPHALCLAYRRTAWSLLEDGAENVGEDRADQWYGTRAAMWVRLQHLATGQTVFFANHHGPLPVDSGGRCGGEATAYNLLKLIASKAHVGDAIFLVGDFNAGPSTETLQSLRGRLFPAYTGSAFDGVDHVLSSCPSVTSKRNLGSGGSDHDALEVVFQL